MNKWICIISFIVILPFFLSAQEEEGLERVKLGDDWTYAMIENGDTIYLSSLREASITMPRTFETLEEKRLYYKYKRSAQKVYPYALQAMEIYKEVQAETEDMKRRKKKKHNKKKAKELKEEFEAPLKKLTKTQGKVLIAMIERELDTSFFNVLKEIRGGFTASYWNALGKMYGYKLKEQFDPEKDPLMEAVLSDFMIDMEKGK